MLNKTDNADILDQDELNLGQSSPVSSLNYVPAQTLANGTTVAAHTDAAARGPGQGVRLLSFSGSSKKSKMITLALQAFSSQSIGGSRGGKCAGPIVARIEFSNGSAIAAMEVNVPLGRVLANSDLNTPRTQGGLIVSLPASSIIVTVRNDAAYYAVDIFGIPTTPLVNGVVPPGNLLGTGASSVVMVGCQAAYGSRPSGMSAGSVRRFLPLVINGALDGSVDDTEQEGSEFLIPAFAKNVRFVRGNPVDGNANISLDVRWVLSESSSICDEIVIPAGSPSPEIPVPTGAGSFLVASTGTGDVYADFAIED